MAELQLEVEQLKNAYREAVWAKSAVLGAPRQKDDWPQLFVLMPFARALEPIYKRHIKKVASAAQLRVARADDFFGAGSIMKDVWSAINAARVIVADCTGRNPNVFYEIGLAHAIGKRTILISQTINDVPFDLRHLRVILYECTKPGMRRFDKDLLRAISDQS